MKPVTFKCDFCEKKGSEDLIKKHELICPKNPDNQAIGKKPRRDRQDLAGKTFGYLTVVSPYYNEVDKKHSFWVCKCKCGNPCIKRQDALFKTPIPSCGCHKKEATSKQWSAQLARRRFGNLTVIRRVKSKDRRALWECKCDCGETYYCFSRYLLSMGVTSCGCKTKSAGELKIRKLLKAQNVLFKEQFSFSDCRGKQNPLRFDFAILDSKGNPIIMLEVNGPQHYEVIRFFGGEQGLQKIKEYDEIKRNYCQAKNLKLIEIEQTKLMKMSDEEILEEIGVKNMWAIEEK